MRPHRFRPPDFQRVFLLGLFLYAGATVLLARCVPTRPSTVSQPPSLIREEALTETNPDAGVLMVPPEKPEPWQSTPPCGRGEHTIHGACYMRWDEEDMAPPCDPGSVVWKKRCYRPIAKNKPNPVSGQ